MGTPACPGAGCTPPPPPAHHHIPKVHVPPPFGNRPREESLTVEIEAREPSGGTGGNMGTPACPGAGCMPLPPAPHHRVPKIHFPPRPREESSPVEIEAREPSGGTGGNMGTPACPGAGCTPPPPPPPPVHRPPVHIGVPKGPVRLPSGSNPRDLSAVEA